MTIKINDELVIWIVDRGINSLGKSPSQMLWSILEKEYGFAKNKIPEELPAFMETLQKVFGSSFSFLDLLFQTLLQQSTGENLEGHGNFIQCVAELRSKVVPNAEMPKTETLTMGTFLSSETTTQDVIQLKANE